MSGLVRARGLQRERPAPKGGSFDVLGAVLR
jgi:hypothetical protein